MTLCIAWQLKGDIYFVSDSRISRKNGDNYLTVSDTAPKIFNIPIRVYGTEPNSTLIYDKDWGLCLAGGYISGSGYADTLSEILSNLQIIEGYSELNGTNLIKIAYKFYELISTELVQTGNKEALTKILIAGVCPQNEETFLYEFGYTFYNDGIKYHCNQIDINNNLRHLIGDSDAIQYFNENSKNIPPNEYFSLLKEITKNDDFKTVGGNLQCGVLKKTHPKYFSIYGILDSELEWQDDIWAVKDKWQFRSIDLNPEIFEGTIHVRKNFLTPFQHIRDKLFKEVELKNEEELNKKIFNKI